jgi:WD40 repeat protein
LITAYIKTARVWDVSTSENKMEMRGHENVVETVVFAPVVAYAAIHELASIEVTFFTLFPRMVHDNNPISEIGR